MKWKRDKRIKTVNGEIPLPDAMIQHIQSFLEGKEAARTMILSKSWYNAWLTRPVLDFDTRDFCKLYPRDFCKFYPESQQVFEELVMKTMQRYQNLNLKIDSFRLSCKASYDWGRDWKAFSHNLTVDAMKMGATAVQLEKCKFPLPQEVLGSETLLKLSVKCCIVDGNNNIRCSRLKSLTLDCVNITSDDDVLKDLISCCISLEELSLSNFHHLPFISMNPFELHKLRRLYLYNVYVGSIFSTNFSSRFPCLKDLSIVRCDDCINVQIVSTSLETVCLKMGKVPAKFDVPNIRKFTYSCSGLPSYLSINGPSREWEFDISIDSSRFQRMSWFINLKKLLEKFRLSRISLCINLYSLSQRQCIVSELEVDVEVVPKPLVLENLKIKAPSESCSALVIHSVGAFHPKFITHGACNGYVWVQGKWTPIVTLRERLTQRTFISNLKDKFGQFGLKKVNVEIYNEIDAEWRPLRPLQLKKAKADIKAKVRLQLIWVD